MSGEISKRPRRAGRTSWRKRTRSTSTSAWDRTNASARGHRSSSRSRVRDNELFVGGQLARAPHSRQVLRDDQPRDRSRSSPSVAGEADARDVDDAVQAARHAYDTYWSKMRPAERGKYIFRVARAIQERARELAIVESMNGGKPIKESRDVDLPLAAAHFFYHAGWADKLDYAFHGRAWRPLGVVGQVIPWNFPLLMAAWKIAPALACGNTVVLKPAETTPLTALLPWRGSSRRRSCRPGGQHRDHGRGGDGRGARGRIRASTKVVLSPGRPTSARESSARRRRDRRRS